MFDPQWEKAAASRLRVNGQAPGPRPSSASVQVRELSWHGRHNPRPQSKDPGSHGSGRSEHLVEEYLSPARLRALAQMPDLRLVSTLEMCVDTREYSLGNFGLHLPSLSQLKLNGSRLDSVRDLGDLDGIGFFPALKELYASYNCISDLSPLCLLEQLEMLDLEGNGVEDLGQVCYLQLCPRLATLTLEGNLVCLRPGPHNEVPLGYNYRAEVRRLIPQIQVLDNVPATLTSLPASRKLDQEWLLVKAAIQEGRSLDGLLPTLDRPHGEPIWRFGPELSLPETQPRAPGPWPLALLVPGGPLPEDLLPKDLAPGDDASNLTHGAGPVLCGNPTRGLRERRHQCQAWEPTEQLPPQRLGGLATNACPPADSLTLADPADSRDVLALAGLEAWRGLRLRQLESWQEGAQVRQGPHKGPEEHEDETGPKTSPSPLNLAPELSRTLGYNLLPSPPKLPMPPDSSSPWGSTDLQFRGRRLRALGSSGPGLDQGLAAVAALRSLEGGLRPKP